MDQEFKDSLEEVFCERNFILSDELDDLQKNLEKAREICSEAKAQVKELISCVEDGECWDDTAAIFSIQQLVFAEKYIKAFEKQLQNYGGIDG